MTMDELQQAQNRHASNLELFIDLAFVFAVTQVATFIANDLTVAGVAKGVLFAWLAWWQWTAFTWAGTAIDFQESGPIRVMVLCMIPAVIVMAVTLPHALTNEPMWFAVAYWLVQIWLLPIQAVSAWGDPETRAAFYRYAPAAAFAPTLMIVGAFFDGSTRLAVWVVAALLFVVSAILGGNSGSEWNVDPVHFAERHALFVIICLGEALVTIGANASEIASEFGLTAATVIAVVVTAGVAGTLWWSYFAYVPTAMEYYLINPAPKTRGQRARDLCSFGHFPIVLGIIAFAVVFKHLLHAPTERLHTADLVFLATAMCSFVGGFMLLQWMSDRTVAPARLAAIVGGIGAAALGKWLPGSAVMAVVGVVLAVVAVYSIRRFSTTQMAAAHAER